MLQEWGQQLKTAGLAVPVYRIRTASQVCDITYLVKERALDEKSSVSGSWRKRWLCPKSKLRCDNTGGQSSPRGWWVILAACGDSWASPDSESSCQDLNAGNGSVKQTQGQNYEYLESTTLSNGFILYVLLINIYIHTHTYIYILENIKARDTIAYSQCLLEFRNIQASFLTSSHSEIHLKCLNPVTNQESTLLSFLKLILKMLFNIILTQ